MTSRRRRHVYLKELLSDIWSNWLILLVGLVPAVAAGVVALELLDANEREALISGALIFVTLEALVLYSILARIGDEINDLAGGGRGCTLIVGPHHAKLLPSGSEWVSDGVIWIAVSCDRGSTLELQLVTHAGVTIRLKNREATQPIWKRIAADPHGAEVWQVNVQHAEDITSLGQFEVRASECGENSEPIVVSLIGTNPAGMALKDKVEIGLLPGVPEDEPMQPVAVP